MSDKKMPEMMDPSTPEKPVGEVHQSRRRACYAAVTLVGEVLHLFPETVYEVSNYNGRDVGITVGFPKTEDGLGDLLRLLTSDARVSHVHTHMPEDRVDVVFRNQPRTYDLRDTFGLDEAWLVLDEDADEYEPESDWWEGGTAISTSPDVKEGGGA